MHVIGERQISEAALQVEQLDFIDAHVAAYVRAERAKQSRSQSRIDAPAQEFLDQEP
ncbi:MAG: hypothetical protein ABIS30_01255 [Gallionella sp.]